ncbi:MAG: hypothetical protein K0R63_1334 [Rickettsiales bacterium]|nr:hypothetical protein [Rickettsiales bacterium]
MVNSNTVVLSCLTIILQGCAAVGFLESNNFDTVVGQGFELEKSGREIAAESRYLKALQLAKESGDKRDIAYAKFYLGSYYRNPNAYNPKKSIRYLNESLQFYANDKAAPIALASYTALTEVYGKEGDEESACTNLRKAQKIYIQKIVLNSDYSPNGEGYKNFFNPVRKKHPFKKFDELIDYYNQELGCRL